MDSVNIDNASEAFCESFAESIKKASIFNITTVLNTNLLKVRGNFLNESNYKSNGVVKFVRKLVEFNEILCTKSTDVETEVNTI